jgi:hypothetical protein
VAALNQIAAACPQVREFRSIRLNIDTDSISGWVKPDFPGFHLHHETQHRAVLNRREFPGRFVSIGPHHVMLYYFWEFKRIPRSAWKMAIHRNTKVQLEVRQALNINNAITMS